MTKWWTHTCKDVGETQIPHGQPCNWCDVTQEDVERKEIEKPLQLNGEDYGINGNASWNSIYDSRIFICIHEQSFSK